MKIYFTQLTYIIIVVISHYNKKYQAANPLIVMLKSVMYLTSLHEPLWLVKLEHASMCELLPHPLLDQMAVTVVIGEYTHRLRDLLLILGVGRQQVVQQHLERNLDNCSATSDDINVIC